MDYKGNVKKHEGNWNPTKFNTIFSVKTINRSIPENSHDLISNPEYFISSICRLSDDTEIGEQSIGEKTVASVRSKGAQHAIDPKTLAKRMRIPLEMAKRTLRVTTQLAMRTSENPSLTRKYSSNDKMLRYNRLNTCSFMDTMFASTKAGRSFRGNTSCQVFVTEFGHTFVVPMEGKSGKSIARAIKRYFKEIGVPKMIICDQAREQVREKPELYATKPRAQSRSSKRGHHLRIWLREQLKL